MSFILKTAVARAKPQRSQSKSNTHAWRTAHRSGDLALQIKFFFSLWSLCSLCSLWLIALSRYWSS